MKIFLKKSNNLRCYYGKPIGVGMSGEAKSLINVSFGSVSNLFIYVLPKNQIFKTMFFKMFVLKNHGNRHCILKKKKNCIFKFFKNIFTTQTRR